MSEDDEDDIPQANDASVPADEGPIFEQEWPPITELDIRLIAASLHDQGHGHVLPDMIEAITGTRPPDEDYSPRKMQIRNPEWCKARKKAERKKYQAERRARMTDEEKAKQIGNLQLWRANNPDKMRAAAERRLEKRKAERKDRDFVTVDLEGFNTGRNFTDDRPDYGREFHEGLARGYGRAELDQLMRDHIVISPEEKLAQQAAFAGWTVHDHKWYLAQHDLTNDPIPSARNKLPGTPPIYIEHRPFLFGAGNDHEQYFLTEDGEYIRGIGDNSCRKVPLSGTKILNAIVDLPKRFGKAIFITFAFNYDVAQILRILDADTAGQLQAGKIVTRSVDDDGAPCEEIVEQATFFWNEFAISYRRGKMFRVGRLNDPANPYKYEEITDPEKREAYIEAGREPVKRSIDYKDEPVTLNDTFGFLQMSFIEAYEGSGISFTLEEKEIIFQGKRKRNIMASLPMDEVVQYQEMELRILCRMVDKISRHGRKSGSQSSALAGCGRDFNGDGK